MSKDWMRKRRDEQGLDEKREEMNQMSKGFMRKRGDQR